MLFEDTLREMEALRREIDRAFQNFGFMTTPLPRAAFLPGKSARRYPLINIHEDKDNIYVEALAPGVDPKSLNVSVIKNALTIAGEKPAVNGGIEPEAFHRNERSAGKFMRNIELPAEVDEKDVKADYKNGILVIKLPKAEEAKPKQINVNVS